MNALDKLQRSSTAWLGVLTAAVTTWSQSTALPVPPWLAGIVVGGYALKEAAAKIAEALKPAPVTVTPSEKTL